MNLKTAKEREATIAPRTKADDAQWDRLTEPLREGRAKGIHETERRFADAARKCEALGGSVAKTAESNARDKIADAERRAARARRAAGPRKMWGGWAPASDPSRRSTKGRK